MAEVKFTIPDKYTAELSDAVCKIYSYDPKSGITKTQFFKNITYSFWRNLVVQYRANNAKDAASATAITDTEDLKDA